MRAADLIALALSLANMPILAQAQDGTREANALRDQARALERIQTRMSDQAVEDDHARRNAARDSQSSRRFDRQ